MVGSYFEQLAHHGVSWNGYEKRKHKVHFPVSFLRISNMRVTSFIKLYFIQSVM